MIIEMLYPDIANLHGDSGNITYLSRCRPDARIVRTSLADAPAFATTTPDLIYLGPMTESGQRKALERLRPHTARLRELIDGGTVFLFTHNAMEIMGQRIRNDSQGYDVPGLGLFPMSSRIDLFGRYNGKVMGQAGGTTVVGYKSQFSMVNATGMEPFLEATRGVGRNRQTNLEGVRQRNFIGTSLLGPLLVMNPLFTKYLLSLIDPDTEPQLAFEQVALDAYNARLADFNDPKRWHEWEQVQPSA